MVISVLNITTTVSSIYLSKLQRHSMFFLFKEVKIFFKVFKMNTLLFIININYVINLLLFIIIINYININNK